MMPVRGASSFLEISGFIQAQKFAISKKKTEVPQQSKEIGTKQLLY